MVLAQSSYAQQTHPSERTVQELALNYLHTQATLSIEYHQELESIYYFKNEAERARYHNGFPWPRRAGLPRLIMTAGSDGVPIHINDYIQYDNIHVVPRPGGLSEEAEAMASVFYPVFPPDEHGEYREYTGPTTFRLVHSQDGWRIQYESLQPTPKEIREGGWAGSNAFEYRRLEIERDKWNAATGEQVTRLVRHLRDESLYMLAAYEYAKVHGILADNWDAIVSAKISMYSTRLRDASSMTAVEYRKSCLAQINQSIEALRARDSRDPDAR